jgi:hypothetical protein
MLVNSHSSRVGTDVVRFDLLGGAHKVDCTTAIETVGGVKYYTTDFAPVVARYRSILRAAHPSWKKDGFVAWVLRGI